MREQHFSIYFHAHLGAVCYSLFPFPVVSVCVCVCVCVCFSVCVCSCSHSDIMSGGDSFGGWGVRVCVCVCVCVCVRVCVCPQCFVLCFVELLVVSDAGDKGHVCHHT